MMATPPFQKILIANRGEIAIRVMRACRELGIGTVAVYSDADAAAPHVRFADEAVRLGPPPSRESYLLGDRVVAAALRTGAQAVHPGYGFLSENATFARLVEDAGLTFVGPPASAMEAMGDKVSARRAMIAAGVPVVPGSGEPLQTEAEARAAADQVGYPVMLKASAGGGGKGMRRVDGPEDLAAALRAARSEAANSFADDRVYLEKLVVRPRHVEVQVFSDAHGHHLHLGERDCSVQRRNQKVVEETPCPVLSPETRAEMTRVATRAAAAISYRGAGTVEFLYDASQRTFYFLEMNTRLQVEHPITEWVTGIDLVKAQVQVAAGRPAPFRQDQVQPRGHAIEVRVYAEDPEAGFMPAPGRIDGLRLPEGPWVRVDGAIEPAYAVPVHYDPLIAKMSVWGWDRAEALARLGRALQEFTVSGVRTTIPFFQALLAHPDFVSGDYATDLIPRWQAAGLRATEPPPDEVFLAAALAQWRRERSMPGPGTAPDGLSPWARAGRYQRMA